MKIPKKDRKEGMLEYAVRLSELYTRIYDFKIRRRKGQIFTPKQVSTFMTNLLEIQYNTIRLLDPGAGTGVLIAAFCERLLNHDRVVNLTIDAYENDHNLLPYLKKILRLCKAKLEEKGHKVEYNIYEQDFISHNERYFREADLLRKGEKPILYDFVISNPPYYKLNKGSPQATVMMELISGQPNIYALFMALSASMVKLGGELVFITPRSFCSGLYYKKFREWFLNRVQIKNIHIFESRKGIFDRDKVLQENIIVKVKKVKEISKEKKITITVSKNKYFKELRKIEVESVDVIPHRNGDTIIRIPTSTIDLEILHIVDRWPATLKDLGIEISTGPVVPFRAKELLLPKLTKNLPAAPLLWMHNMKNMRVIWPLKKNKKASAICVCDRAIPLLLPIKNYVLLKRFSSKEQKRRLYAATFLASKFPYKTIGIENHINYIYRPNGNLSVYETFGIAAILNTTVIDNFFRSHNGNTQVNATDIRNLPFPQVEAIKKIGKLVYESQSYRTGFDLDNIVAGILGINVEIIKNLNKGEIKG